MVDVQDLVRQLEDYAVRVRDDAADFTLDACRAAAPVSQATPTNLNPGRLRDSLEIQAKIDSSPVFSVTIGSSVEYAAYTDDVDTREHLITAPPPGKLRFWWDRGPSGPGIYAMPFVRHPGTRGQRWFTEPMADRWENAVREAAI